MIAKKFNLLEKWMNGVGVTIVAAMMLLVVVNILGRYLFNSPFETTLEFTEFFMLAIVYLGLSYTQSRKANIVIDLLTVRLSRRGRAVCDLIAYLGCFALFALIVWHGTRMFIDSYEMREITMGRVELPVYPSKLLVPVGSFVACIRFVIDIFESVKIIRGRAA